MENKKNIEAQIEHALNSMDGHERAKPRPYFATRLNARLLTPKDSTIWDKLYSIITRPVIAAACIAVILLFNILMISSNRDLNSVKFQAETSSEWQVYSTTATTNALYDVENLEP